MHIVYIILSEKKVTNDHHSRNKFLINIELQKIQNNTVVQVEAARLNKRVCHNSVHLKPTVEKDGKTQQDSRDKCHSRQDMA